MSKLLINDSDKLLVGSNGKAYAVRNLDVLKGSTSPVDFTAAAGKLLRLMRYGKCEQNGTPTPNAPVDIVCNNGALRYGALGRNLIDPSAANIVLGYYINKADGVIKPATSNFMFAGYMPVTPGKTYVAYGRRKSGNDLSDYNRIAWYDSTKTWIEGADYTQNRVSVVTAPANAAYARFSCNPSGNTATVVTQELVDSYNWMFAEGTAEITPFVPFVGGIYTDGTPEVLTLGAQTVNVPMLLSVGAYKDEAELIHGIKTGRVGIKVFDGTENWFAYTSSTLVVQNATSDWGAVAGVGGYCTHLTVLKAGETTFAGACRFATAFNVYEYKTAFGVADVAGFKAYLAAQYAAGTPVIVIYPLATPTTENVTPQPLNTGAGQNTLTDTAEVSNPEYNLIYKI